MDKVENIKNPDFLKDLNNDELDTLGADIREFILENVSNTGGHLSSNLGITDLTLIKILALYSSRPKLFI